MFCIYAHLYKWDKKISVLRSDWIEWSDWSVIFVAKNIVEMGGYKDHIYNL